MTNKNVFKLKHFYHIEGSTAIVEDVLKEAEDFINENDIDPVEISHSFSPAPQRCLSIFITYVDKTIATDAITEALDHSEGVDTPEVTKTSKKVNGAAKKSKSKPKKGKK